MAEDTIVLTHESEIHGDTRISVRVIEIIAGLAAGEVEGVARLRGGFTDRAQEAFGRHVRGKGVEIHQADDGLQSDVYVYLNYGVSVPKVARKIQEHVTMQIAAMTGLEVNQVNVHVQGVVSNKPTLSVDPNNLFGENVEEKGAK